MSKDDAKDDTKNDVKDDKATEEKPVPTLSLSTLWEAIKKLEINDKCFCWGAVVYFLSTILPWTSSEGMSSSNAWNLNSFLTLANFVILGGLLLQLSALAGFGDKSMKSWLKLYRYAMPGAFFICLLTLVVTSNRDIGMLIGMFAICIHAFGLYAMLDKLDILPMRITK